MIEPAKTNATAGADAAATTRPRSARRKFQFVIAAAVLL